MDVEDHVGGMESYRGVRMGGQIVEELVSMVNGVFCRLCLLHRYRGEGCKDGEIDVAGIVEDTANDALYACDLLWRCG